jgi:hypothetical protein
LEVNKDVGVRAAFDIEKSRLELERIEVKSRWNGG